MTQNEENTLTDFSDDFLPDIMPFAGDFEMLNFFFDSVQDLVSINEWSEEKSIVFLKSKLLGDALSFFKHTVTTEKCTTINQIYVRFQAHFIDKSPPVTMKDLCEARLLHNESIASLRQRIQTMVYSFFGNTLPATAIRTMTSTYFIQALPSHIRTTIIEEGISNLYDIRKRAEQLHSGNNIDRTNHVAESSADVISDNIEGIPPTVKSLQSVNTESTEETHKVESNLSKTHNFEHILFSLSSNTSSNNEHNDSLTHEDELSPMLISPVNHPNHCIITPTHISAASVNNSPQFSCKGDNENVKENKVDSSTIKDSISWKDPLLNISIDTIRKEQENDPHVTRISSALSDKQNTKYFMHKNLNVLCLALRGQEKNFRIVLPNSLMLDVVNSYHSNHASITKMYFNLRKRYTWPCMFYHVRNCIIACKTCIKPKSHSKQASPQLKSYMPQGDKPSPTHPYNFTPQCSNSYTPFFDSGIGSDLYISKVLKTVKIDQRQPNKSPNARKHKNFSRHARNKLRSLEFGSRVFIRNISNQKIKWDEPFIILKKVNSDSVLIQREGYPESKAFVKEVYQLHILKKSPTQDLVPKFKNSHTPFTRLQESYPSGSKFSQSAYTPVLRQCHQVPMTTMRSQRQVVSLLQPNSQFNDSVSSNKQSPNCRRYPSAVKQCRRKIFPSSGHNPRVSSPGNTRR